MAKRREAPAVMLKMSSAAESTISHASRRSAHRPTMPARWQAGLALAPVSATDIAADAELP